jgi:hypothetical protein
MNCRGRWRSSSTKPSQFERIVPVLIADCSTQNCVQGPARDSLGLKECLVGLGRCLPAARALRRTGQRKGPAAPSSAEPSQDGDGDGYWTMRRPASSTPGTECELRSPVPANRRIDGGFGPSLVIQQVGEIVPSFPKCRIGAGSSPQSRFGFDRAGSRPKHVTEIDATASDLRLSS